jgi:hypothetical protein
MKKTLYLTLFLLCYQATYAQSTAFTELKNMLLDAFRDNGFSIMDSGTIKLTAAVNYIQSEPDQEYTSGNTYAFAFVFDNCESCEIDIFYYDDKTPGRKYLKSETTSHNGATTVLCIITMEETKKLNVRGGTNDGKTRSVYMAAASKN